MRLRSGLLRELDGRPTSLPTDGLTFGYVREPLLGGPAEAGPGGVPKEDSATRLRYVRHPDEAPLLPFAGVEGVLDLLPSLRVLVQHEFLGEVPPVWLVRHRDLLSTAPYDFLSWSGGLTPIRALPATQVAAHLALVQTQPPFPPWTTNVR